jgi:hypothetical protein
MAENPTVRKLAFAGAGASWLSHAGVPVKAIVCLECGTVIDITIAPPNVQPDFYLDQHQFRTARDLIVDFWRLNRTFRGKLDTGVEKVQAYDDCH